MERIRAHSAFAARRKSSARLTARGGLTRDGFLQSAFLYRAPRRRFTRVSARLTARGGLTHAGEAKGVEGKTGAKKSSPEGLPFFVFTLR